MTALLQHFGLAANPFGESGDPHSRAIADLRSAILEQRCFALITGVSGIGKTSLLRALESSLGAKSDFALLSSPFDTEDDLLCAVMTALGATPSPGGYFSNWLRLHDDMVERREHRGPAVLVFDGAHRLPARLLDMIRRLSTLESAGGKLIQIILSGHPSLLEAPQLADRVTVVVELRPMTPEQVKDYVGHRLAAAGRTGPLFTDEAVEAVAQRARGIPRHVNRICLRALALAGANGAPEVDAATIESACAELYPFQAPSAPNGRGAAVLTMRKPPERDRQVSPNESLFSTD